MSQRLFARVATPLVMSALLIAVATVVAAPQGRPQELVPRAEKAVPIPPEPPPAADEGDAEQKASVKVDKLIAAYDLKPHALPPIPDDPPPHEGAMISLPIVVDPPDWVLVEVLEALPGRPISGERLVRPDGKISLSFYGEVEVRGLTVPQIKVAIVKRLRTFLPDDTLGLISSPDIEEFVGPAAGEPSKVRNPAIPELPQEDRNRFNPIEEPREPPGRPRSAKRSSFSGSLVRGRPPVRHLRARRNRVESQHQGAPAREKEPSEIDAGGKGRAKIAVEIDGQGHPAAEPVQAAPSHPIMEWEGPWRAIPPEESLRVYVDITVHNSKNYYILGDILVPGKLPWTGNETVLDALQYGGGLLPTAEAKDIRLIRPGRGGKPAKVYKVDLEAIQDQGDIRSNYQLFPGDRLIVGRNEVVKKTVEIDRLDASIGAIAGSIQRIANSIRAVQAINPADADDVLKELVDFWAREISRKGDLKLDEATLREALLQKRKAASAPDPKKRP
jgi:protein involved in polysaccharide export with SLBB domain